MADLVATFPEVSMGVNLVDVTLRDGTTVEGVRVANADAIVREAALPDFDAADVLDVRDRSGDPPPRDIRER